MKIVFLAAACVAFTMAQVYQPQGQGGYQPQGQGGYQPQVQGIYQPQIQIPVFPPFQPIQQNVCDFDSSILIGGIEVEQTGTGGGYSGGQNGYGSYGNGNQGHNWHRQNHRTLAHRVKCADIAVLDDASCSMCCRLAARMDWSAGTDKVEGILVDQTQLNDPKLNPETPTGYSRVKRQSHGPSAPQPIPDEVVESSKPFGKETSPPGIPVQKETRFNANVKCMCCAPRSRLIPFVQPQFPQYPQTGYPQPGYPQQPNGGYRK
ncbi:hypothetical protein L596_005824 [Steinernema carpocapsae]|uniref:Uncharacterized protein n=1 Tax=Steinernema carpocapsae TaxID=34508 RepID=A0A4U8V1P9_STECR|nr:hypothetical protein L596_005824 [Steinernema carpocapsae]